MTTHLDSLDSIGTHNTLDGAAPGTDFAAVVFYTEAIPRKIERELKDTHDLYVCRWQKDLVIAMRKTLDVSSKVKMHYRLVHIGIAKITPRRGTFWLTFDLDDIPHAAIDEHRINAAFPPYKRGERWLRPRWWKKHTKISIRIIRRLKKRGRVVVAGGDLNTPRGVSGYKGELREVGSGLDRLGATFRLVKVQVLSREGSDHYRLRAEKENT